MHYGTCKKNTNKRAILVVLDGEADVDKLLARHKVELEGDEF